MQSASIAPQRVFRLYEAGVEFKNSIGLYETAQQNEQFFAGDQWAGVNAPDLPKPVVNFLKRACQQKVAEVLENPVAVSFEPVEYPQGEARGLSDDGAAALAGMFDADWNRMNMEKLNLDGLLDAAVTGDCILYSFWDADAATGQTAAGRVCAELVGNVDFYPGNPNEREVQKQPYLILARRERVRDVRAQAAAFGRPKQEIALIVPDGDEAQGGRASRGQEDAGDGFFEKCLTLLYLFRDGGGQILAQKTVRGAVVRPLWNTRLTRYPFAMMNWEKRGGCCHGRAEITGLIPVQRYVNQMYAMAMLFTMQSACPKAVFNQGMVRAWSNAVGAAIPVNGDIGAAVRYLEPPKLPGDVYNLPKTLMDTTLKLIGVSDLTLGDVSPTNTSAIVLAREASSMPVRSIRQRYYALVEDFARNWLDLQLAYGTVPRYFTRRDGARRSAALFDPEKIKNRLWAVKVDVGAASAWSEINAVQTLNSLYGGGVIDARQYVERLPDGYLPMRGKLLSELAARGTDRVNRPGKIETEDTTEE